MAKLNEKNDKTKKIIHLFITDICGRHCKYCCNKQYDVNSIEVVTKEELQEAEIIFLTGGEPFYVAEPDPCELAQQIKNKYPNIKKVYAYTNAYELFIYLLPLARKFYGIDGLTISIKNNYDKQSFPALINIPRIQALAGNIRLYTFDGFDDIECPDWIDKRHRDWQIDFVPANDSIFRRL